MAVEPPDTDLSAAALRAAMPGRAIRAYRALLSTEADALAWARAGGPEGAVVAADYQASPRGRAGLIWELPAGRGLCFSLLLRPRLPAEREGWLYTIATSGVADIVGAGAAIEWPDEVITGDRRAGAVGVHVQLGPEGTEWAVVNILLPAAVPPRAPLIASLVDAIERRYGSSADIVLGEYLPRCRTLCRMVRARLIPLGPGGLQVVGRAVTVLDDGALLLETSSGKRVAVRPQHLGVLEDAS